MEAGRAETSAPDPTMTMMQHGVTPTPDVVCPMSLTISGQVEFYSLVLPAHHL